ncbi:MAG: D-alanine--D-alanine ligase [Bacteroidales bacterium]|nr:D-alanine--D-alanine ligase [Bacteroidales bacterium]
MHKKNIAVLYGGFSGEYEISLKSSMQVCNWIDKEKYNVFPILVNKRGWFHPNEKGNSVDKNIFGLILKDKIIKFDYAFIMIHGTPGENGLITGYLESIGVPHSTCSTEVLAVTFNKFYCKQVLLGVIPELNFAKSVYIRKNSKYNLKDIIKITGLPVFVKPCNSGSSVGITKAHTVGELSEAINLAFKYDNQLIIEEYIKGTEISCGLVKTKTLNLVLPITEIVPKKEFFDYEAKYTPGMSEEITPARISEYSYTLCQEVSSKIYDFLGCKGFVRIDYILQNEKLYFLEINTIPGMSPASIIPQQVRYYGLEMSKLLTIIIEDSFHKNIIP